VTFELGTLLALILAIIAGAVGYGKLHGVIDALAARVGVAEDWKLAHESDAEAKRSVFDIRLTAFEVRLGRGEEKFEQISRDIGDIKKDVRTLLTRRRDDRSGEDRRDGE
jgi:hypothetical protein